LALKAELSNLDSVKEVRYISREEALEIFKEYNTSNPEILSALRELDNNPLTATLLLTPKSPDNIEILTHELNKIESDIVDYQGYSTYESMLKKIDAVTDRVTQAGLILAGFFIFISLMVIFNSVRVAIYTHSAEISIMRLVGASNAFIHMPYIFSSLVYSLVSTMAIIFFFYPFLSLLQPYLETFFVDYNINIIDYFNSHFLFIFGAEFLGIALVNVAASYFAARKYAQI